MCLLAEVLRRSRDKVLLGEKWQRETAVENRLQRGKLMSRGSDWRGASTRIGRYVYPSEMAKRYACEVPMACAQTSRQKLPKKRRRALAESNAELRTVKNSRETPNNKSIKSQTKSVCTKSTGSAPELKVNSEILMRELAGLSRREVTERRWG